MTLRGHLNSRRHRHVHRAGVETRHNKQKHLFFFRNIISKNEEIQNNKIKKKDIVTYLPQSED